MKGLKQIKLQTKNFISMIGMTCTPTIFGFVCLSVSRKHLFKTCLGETSKRLEQQTREDNAVDKDTLSWNFVWECNFFVFGIP